MRLFLCIITLLAALGGNAFAYNTIAEAAQRLVKLNERFGKPFYHKPSMLGSGESISIDYGKSLVNIGSRIFRSGSYVPDEIASHNNHFDRSAAGVFLFNIKKRYQKGPAKEADLVIVDFMPEPIGTRNRVESVLVNTKTQKVVGHIKESRIPDQDVFAKIVKKGDGGKKWALSILNRTVHMFEEILKRRKRTRTILTRL